MKASEEQGVYKQFVGCLISTITESQLKECFEDYLGITSIKIVRNEQDNFCKGYAFINIKGKENLAAVLEADIMFNGRRLDISQAHSLDKKAISLQKQTECKIHVKNLHKSVNDQQLKDFFSKFGPLVNGYVIYDPSTGASKKFGYVQFETKESVKKVLDLKNLVFKHKSLVVSRFIPKSMNNNNNGKNNGNKKEQSKSQGSQKSISPHSSKNSSFKDLQNKSHHNDYYTQHQQQRYCNQNQSPVSLKDYLEIINDQRLNQAIMYEQYKQQLYSYEQMQQYQKAQFDALMFNNNGYYMNQQQNSGFMRQNNFHNNIEEYCKNQAYYQNQPQQGHSDNLNNNSAIYLNSQEPSRNSGKTLNYEPTSLISQEEDFVDGYIDDAKVREDIYESFQSIGQQEKVTKKCEIGLENEEDDGYGGLFRFQSIPKVFYSD